MNIDDSKYLIDQLLDETITESDMARLNEWIKQDPQNADHFAQRSHLHSRLFDWAAVSDSKVVKMHPNPRRRRFAIYAAAAVVAFLIVAALVSQPKPGIPVATLVASPGGALRYQRNLVEADSAIRTGRYQLEKGVSSIRFENGVDIVVEAPAVFQIESAMKMTLAIGRIAANVPPEAIGFEIATPSAQVIDHGTEFAVEVNNDQSSEVHVFNGEVEVKPLADGDDKTASDPVHLFSNAATRVEFASHTPLGIPIDNHRFLRTLDEPRKAYSPMVKRLNPILYFRMGVPKDGVTMRDVVGESDGKLIERGGRRPPFCDGRIGAAGRFAGPVDGAFVHVPDYPKTDFALSGTCWIYAESLPRNAPVAKNSQKPNKGQFRWRLNHDSGCLEVRINQKDGTEVILRDHSPLPIKSWQHIAFVADGKKLKLYRNGQSAGQTLCGPVAAAHSPELLIGGRWKNKGGINSQTNSFWHGRIDEFALFNHALTAEDCATLYQIVQ